MVNNGYLLDANYLIYLSKEEQHSHKKVVLEKIKEILVDENSRFVITPLIAYEFLRFVKWEDNQQFEKLQALLDNFEVLDIDMEAAQLACDLYRFDVFESLANNIPRNFDKRKFDMFHFSMAKTNQLEVLSKDADMQQIETLYQHMLDQKGH
ncbi:type II toxin-antitoxin system VapC family toxin [Pasteurella multocida]